MFAIVHFEDEDCVECVPTSWIDGGKCYWPANDARNRIRNQAIPDKERWPKYRIRRLGNNYQDYGTARKYCIRAEDTSNLESGDSGEESRKRKRPQRLVSEGAADEGCDTDEPTMAEQTEIPSLPKPRKQIHSSPYPTNESTNELLQQEPTMAEQTEIPSLPKPRKQIHSSPDPTNESTNELLQQVISKLDKLERGMEMLKRQFRTEIEDLQVNDLLPAGQKLNLPLELDDFEKSLDEDSRRKIINSLAPLQGGSDAGIICRTIMRALMTNHLMSQYSGTGQKGKLAFIGKPIYRIIMSAARKASGKTLAFHDIRSEMLEVLRNAPNKPGGANYVKKHQQRQPVITDEDSDSE